MTLYIVRLHGVSRPCYLAPWTGDPGRTFRLGSARRYKTRRGAAIALGHARRYRPFSAAEVVQLDCPPCPDCTGGHVTCEDCNGAGLGCDNCGGGAGNPQGLMECSTCDGQVVGEPIERGDK